MGETRLYPDDQRADYDECLVFTQFVKNRSKAFEAAVVEDLQNRFRMVVFASGYQP
jgi:hypothetical protein